MDGGMGGNMMPGDMDRDMTGGPGGGSDFGAGGPDGGAGSGRPGGNRGEAGGAGTQRQVQAIESASLAFMEASLKNSAAAKDWLALDAPRWLRAVGSLSVK